MPVYKIKYLNEEGRKVSSKVFAASPEAAQAMFIERGRPPLSVQWDLSSLGGGRMKPAEVAELFESLSWLLGSGVDLRESLAACRGQAPSETSRAALDEVLHRVEAGEDLSSAMKNSGFFSEEAAGLVETATTAGEQSTMLKEYAEELRWRIKTSSDLRTKMIYPAVTILATFASAIFLFTHVLPQLSVIIPPEKMPTTSRIAMTIAKALRTHWFVIVPALVALVVLGWRGFVKNRVKIYPLLARFKLPRRLLGGLCYGKYFSGLGLLLKSGVPLPKALEVSAGNDTYLEAFSNKVRSYIARGGTLADVVAEEPLLGDSASSVLAAGQRSRNLPEACRRLGKQYQEESRRILDNFSEIIQPAVLLLAGGLIIFIMVTIFQPLYSTIGGGIGGLG